MSLERESARKRDWVRGEWESCRACKKNLKSYYFYWGSKEERDSGSEGGGVALVDSRWYLRAVIKLWQPPTDASNSWHYEPSVSFHVTLPRVKINSDVMSHTSPHLQPSTWHLFMFFCSHPPLIHWFVQSEALVLLSVEGVRNHS